MKLVSIGFALSLALVACKKDAPAPAKPEPTKEEPTAAPKEGVPCEQEIMLECPEGQVDGCTKTPREGDTHACVAK